MSITDFSQELQGLCEKLPVQASKIKTLTQLAVKESNVTGNNKQSAQIINEILQFARTLKPEGMLPLVYLIDSIIRSSSKLPNNVYKAGFESIFPRLFKIVKLCLLGDKDKIKRVISIWKANNLLDPNLLDDVLMIFQGLTEQSSAANVPAMNVNAVDPRKNDLNPVQTFLMPDLKPAMPSPVATMNDLPQIDMTMLNKLASSIGNQSTLQSTAQAVNTSHINTVPQQQSVAQMAPALFPQLTNMMAPPFMNIQQPAPVNLDQNQQLQANAAMMSNLLALMAASGQQPGAPNAINMNALLGIAAMGGVPGMGLPIPNMPFNSSMNTLPEQDSHRNQGDRFDRRDDKNRERRDYRDYRDNDSHRKDERSNRRDNHRDSQKKGGPITLNLADGPECAPAYHDPSIPQDCLKSI